MYKTQLYILIFCSFSPANVTVALRSYETKVFPGTRSRLLTGEISVTEIIFVSYEHNFPLKRENFLFTRHSGKLYPASGKTFPHMNKTKLFHLSKCFLGNRDNVCPYEQALSCSKVVDILGQSVRTQLVDRLFADLLQVVKLLKVCNIK